MRAAQAFVHALLVLAPLSGPITGTAGAYVRNDLLTPHYSFAWLTYSSSSEAYSFAWDASAPTENPPAPWSPSCSAITAPCYYTNQANVTLRELRNDRYSSSGYPLPPDDDIPFATTPKTLHLNASRLIQLDVYITPTGLACSSPPRWNYELYLDGRLLAASVHGLNDQVRDYSLNGVSWGTAPKFVENFCTLRMRMQPEIDVIPAGSSLRLVIRHVDQDRAYALGAADPARTILRFPVFAPEELPYRVPALTPTPAPSTAEASAALLFLLSPAGRTRRRAAMAVVMALVLSGCASKNEAGADGNGDGKDFGGNLDVKRIEGNGTAAGKASIFGSVHDDVRLPVVGAVVSLLETRAYTVSKQFGAFSFRDLEPATYTLRVERSGFKVFQETVSVAAGETYRIEVGLEPEKPGTARPHVHDYWQDKDSATLVAEAFGNLDCTFAAHAPSTSPVCKSFDVTIAPKPNEYNVVRAGTVEVEVTLTWDKAAASPYFQYAGVRFRSPNDPTNETGMYPRGSGVPTRIRIGWEMADPGHQQFSTWAFTIWAPNNQTYWAADLTDQHQGKPWGPVKVTIRILRGVVPLEASHPDFWGGLPTRPIVDAEVQPPSPPCVGSNYAVCTPSQVNISFPSTAVVALVPPETEWLEVHLQQSREARIPFEWRLGFKGARTPQGGCAVNKPSVEGYLNAPTPTTDGKHWTWRFRVDPVDTDPYYAKASNVCFFLAPSDSNAYYLDYCAKSGWCAWAGVQPGEESRYPLFFGFHVTAHRDAFVS